MGAVARPDPVDISFMGHDFGTRDDFNCIFTFQINFLVSDGLCLRARYYQPNVGRFLTRDIYTGDDEEPLSLHLYTYCEYDGVNAVDPSGHWNEKVHKGMTRVVAKTIGFSTQEANIIAIASDKADEAVLARKARKKGMYYLWGIREVKFKNVLANRFTG